MSALLLAVVMIPACNDERSDEPDGPASPPADVLASGVVGPAGGTVQVADPTSPYFGARIDVPPGALAAPTSISIRAVPEEFAPDVHALEFGRSEILFAVPALVTVTVSPEYVQDFNLALLAGVHLVSHTTAGSDILEAVRVDVGARTVSAETPRSGRFAGLIFPPPGGLGAAQYRLIGQSRMLATEAFVRSFEGGDYVVSPLSPGTRRVTVGKGTLDALGTSSRNLVLLHSTGSDATQFVGNDDLIEGLSSEYENVVTYQFPSGRPIAENANWLYNELRRRAGPGFAADLLGYSMGGVVARYAVEASSTDPARRSLPNFGPASTGLLSNVVGRLITLGAPNAGIVDEALAALAGLEGFSLGDAGDYFPGILDLRSVGPALNAAYADDPAIRYFLIAGASNDGALSALIPGDDDGLVAVSSATGVPALAPPEEAAVFPPAGRPGFVFSHSNLHSEAVPNGIRDAIVAWLARSRT